jgi:hypothetical protein
MVRALESDLSALRTRPTTAPASKPDTSDVEIPAPTTGDTSAPAIVEEADDASESASAPDSELDTPAGASDQRGETSSNGASGGPETSEVDVRTLFEQSHEPRSDVAPAEPISRERESAEAAPSPTVRPTGFQPIDLANPEGGVDADILDDDAFFATLRDAVHDEKPLGPRDEGDDITGENRFFDQDADRGSFRDVFRRRR